MEYMHRDSRDVPFGWVELLRAALAEPRQTKRELLRSPAPGRTPAPAR